MVIPVLRRYADGRLAASCGRCLAQSIGVVAESDVDVWAVLERLGWSLYSPDAGARPQPLCPGCTTYPNAIQ